MFHVREMTEQDIESVSQIERESFSDPWSAAGIADMLHQPRYVTKVAEEKGQILGYVAAYTVADECELVKIAVHKEARRKGVGELLFQELRSCCEEKGISVILLDVREGNEAAIAFYQKHGFAVDGIRKNFYEHPKEHAILMSRKILTS